MAGIGFPLLSSRDTIDFFCENSLQTECDEAGRVMFIGATCDPAYVVRYRGVDAFDLPARELFEMMAAADRSGSHEFDALEYCFPNQILTLWEADRQYDCRRKGSRQVWGQVGLGNAVYMAAIKALGTDD